MFLIDVSGSMQSPDKLPLLKNAFRLLTDQLTARDRVSMVVYAGSSGVVLEPTPGDQKHKIREAIDRLEAGGSTNGAEGIERAYQLAHDAHIKGGINRVVLATDGDFNVGMVNFEALVDMAERAARQRRRAHDARLRHRQLQRSAAGAARGCGQRQLRVRRHAVGSAQGARVASCPRRCSRSPRT